MGGKEIPAIYIKNLYGEIVFGIYFFVDSSEFPFNPSGMPLTYLKSRFQRAMKDGPSCMRWLEAAAPAAHDQQYRVRKALLFFQLPLMVALAFAHFVGKQLQLLEPGHPVLFWVITLALVAVLWPLPWLRLGVAAHQSIGASPPRFVFRLRSLAILCFLFVAVTSLLILTLVALAIWITVRMPG